MDKQSEHLKQMVNQLCDLDLKDVCIDMSFDTTDPEHTVVRIHPQTLVSPRITVIIE